MSIDAALRSEDAAERLVYADAIEAAGELERATFLRAVIARDTFAIRRALLRPELAGVSRETVERLGRRVAERLLPWGAPAVTSIDWGTWRPRLVPRITAWVSELRWHLGHVALAKDKRPTKGVQWLSGSPAASDFAESVAIHATWREAVRTNATWRAGYYATRPQLPEAWAGAPIAAAPNPLEPLLDLYATGYVLTLDKGILGLHTLGSRR